MLLIAAAVVPVLFVGAGFGAGKLLSGGHGESEAALTHQSDAGEQEAKALIEAAEQKDKAAAEAHPTQDGESHAPKPAAHANEHSKPEDHSKAAEKPKKASSDVVKLGQVTVPIYKPMSVTYVVADLGVAMSSAEMAAHYRVAENAVRLRDNIMQTFRQATENPKMRRASLDSNWLSKTLSDNLRAEFGEAQEVIFLTLFKKDVPRS